MRDGLSAFGSMLRHFRERAGMSQELLAERAGLSLRGVSDLERGARTTPRLETVRMLADGLALDDADRAALIGARNASGDSRAATTGATRLPTPSTSFVGRRAEIATIADLVRSPGVRLVTLTGPGGVGKTRLAMEVARGLDHVFTGGVVFAALASVQDRALVLPTIAASLGAPDTGSAGLLDLLALTLRDRPILLLLDNVEQVVTSAPDIAALLERCPSLTILATSRVVLHIAAERVVPISPLPLPDEARGTEAENLADTDALAMFLDRARAVDPDFALTDENIATVAALVRRLDGLPLAIELAAAWTRVLPPAALLARMDRQLPMLTGGGRDAPERQQTMRNAIAWSYDLLGPREQRMFRRLSIFRAGFTLDAAEKVLQEVDGFDGMEVLDGLTALVDSSLLRRPRQEGAPARFVMLATVREYGLDQLSLHDEEEETREAAYRRWYAPLASKAQTWTSPQGQAEWLELLEREHDNLRGALSWLIDHNRIEDALDLSGSLWFFRWIRGHYAEARDQYELLLRHPQGAGRTIARGKALVGLGVIAMHQGDSSRSFEALREAVSILRDLDDQQQLCLALLCYGTAYFMTGQIDDAERYIEESHALAITIGDKVLEASSLGNLHILAGMRGDWEKARRLLHRKVVLARSTGDTWGLALGLLNLGAYALQDGDLHTAETYARESLDLILALKDKRDMPGAYSIMSEIARQRGSLPEAESWLEEAIQVTREMGDQLTLARCVSEQARLALMSGDTGRALHLIGEAAQTYHDLGDHSSAVSCLDTVADVAFARGEYAHAAWCIGVVDRAYSDLAITRADSFPKEHAQRVDGLIGALGEPGWRKHWSAGYGHDTESVLDVALGWEPEPVTDATVDGEAAAGRRDAR